MRAIGLTCGIGSMLIGAKQLGYKVMGNIEWRKYYHTGTFEKNFNAPMWKDQEELYAADFKNMYNAEIAYGHPECGSYSNLHCGSKKNVCDPGDIPLFIDLVRLFKPKFFVMDNLPKALLAVPMKEWIHRLGDIYDLFPEWVSNYHYGNTQINRRRFFMIGALKEFNFVFKPGEYEHDKRLKDAIFGLPTYEDIYCINHVHRKDSDIVKGWGSHNFDLTKHKDTKHVTLAEFKKVIKDYPVKKNFAYYNRFGESKLRPGYSKIVLDNYSPVLSGGGSAPDNHYRADTLNALTIRERARIQGCPDDFIFYPLDYMNDHKTYVQVYKQTGKFMPVEFNRFIAEQIAYFLQDYHNRTYSQLERALRPHISGERLIKNNPYIDEAKLQCCKPNHCEHCWLREEGCQKYKERWLLTERG